MPCTACLDPTGWTLLTLFLSDATNATGSVAASDAKGKKGSRGKKGRLTEAEEDEQLLKSAQSKRRVVRVDKQPSILAEHCRMHEYQLEGLNWLIKLHCNGINGILADEVRTTDSQCPLSLWKSLNLSLVHLDGSWKDITNYFVSSLPAGISRC